MNIIILNSGSSSMKFQLIEMPSEKLICSSLHERIRHQDAVINYKTEKDNLKKVQPIESFKLGLQKMVDHLLDPERGVIKNTAEIEVIGHRVVHGGNSFSNTKIGRASCRERV